MGCNVPHAPTFADHGLGLLILKINDAQKRLQSTSILWVINKVLNELFSSESFLLQVLISTMYKNKNILNSETWKITREYIEIKHK